MISVFKQTCKGGPYTRKESPYNTAVLYAIAFAIAFFAASAILVIMPIIVPLFVSEYLTLGWWINELESLGLSVKSINEFNDLNEIRDLTEGIKQDQYMDYKTDYFGKV